LLAQSVAPEWLLLPGPDRHVFVVGAEEKPPCPARVRSSELENRSLGEGMLTRPARHFRRLSGYSLRLGNQRYIFGKAIYRNKNLRIKHLYRMPRIARLTLGKDFKELLHFFAVNPDGWSLSASIEHPASQTVVRESHIPRSPPSRWPRCTRYVPRSKSVPQANAH